ncbi:MAG: tRNA lysidine(34) synthetase TilS [Bacteroidales bacterium]|nr:tRNA lysidine(34) synthetase TilS [Bacteroidales bacterium]
MSTVNNRDDLHPFELKVKGYIAEHSLLDDGCRTVVGLSGGADSVALFTTLTALGYECKAVHCNFQLRGEESERDNLFTVDLCRKLGIELTVCKYDTHGYAAEKGISIEMAARELRYNDFERIMKEKDARAICIGHHRDDSIETVIMNLIRGTGLKGLTGIKPINGNIVRPLLSVSREEIESYLRERGQPYVTDKTNLETCYTRNKVRLNILPLMREINPSVDNSIIATAEHLQQAYEFYRSSIEQTRSKTVSEEDGRLTVDIENLKQAPSVEGFLFELLSPMGFNETQIANIAASLDSQPGSRFISDSHIVLKDRNKLIVTPLICETAEPLTIRTIDGFTAILPDGRKLKVSIKEAGQPISKQTSTATFDADLLPDTLTVRVWREGDWFIPFGMKGRKLVSDYMTDCKISLADKERQLIVVERENIVWVLGRRSDNRYRVSDTTRRQLVLTIV